eukprot:scaffold60268_cov27-Tisochrysis_lutea.AAC.19
MSRFALPSKARAPRWTVLPRTSRQGQSRENPRPTRPPLRSGPRTALLVSRRSGLNVGRAAILARKHSCSESGWELSVSDTPAMAARLSLSFRGVTALAIISAGTLLCNSDCNEKDRLTVASESSPSSENGVSRRVSSRMASPSSSEDAKDSAAAG